MIALLLVGAAIAYLGVALFIAMAFHRRTEQLLLPALLLIALLVLPIHEFVLGLPGFRKFDANHRSPNDPAH